MAGNIVEILVGARDTDAIKSLDDVKLRLDELARKVAEAKVRLAGDKEAQVQLDKMTLSLLRLDHKTANPKISLEGALRAEAQAAALDLTMDRLNKKFKVTTESTGGFMGVLAGLVTKLIPSGIQGMMGIEKATNDAAGAGLNLKGALIAVGAVLAPFVLATLTPLIASLALVTVGFAGLAAVAIPAIRNLSAAMSANSSATDAYKSAVEALNTAIHRSPADMTAYRAALAGLEPDLRSAAKLLRDQHVTWEGLSRSQQRNVLALANNSAALKTLLPDQKAALDALLKQRAAWESMSPAQQKAAVSLHGIGAEFHKLAQSVQPQIMQAFATSLDIIKRLMPGFEALVKAAAKGLDLLLKDIDNWVKSPAGQKFIRWMQTEGPAAIHHFITALFSTMQVLGQVLHFLYDWGRSLTADWRSQWHDVAVIVETAVRFIEGLLRGLVGFWRSAVALVRSAWAAVYQAIVAPVLSAYHAIVGLVQSIGSALASIPGMVNSALGGIPGKVLSFMGFASGGIVGAAGGGPRGGLTWVGEQGPELVRLPYGSTVYPAGQSKAMATQGGGGNTYNISVSVPPAVNMAEVGRQITTAIREFERSSGKGWRTP